MRSDAGMAASSSGRANFGHASSFRTSSRFFRSHRCSRLIVQGQRNRPCLLYDYSLETVEYKQAWDLQRRWVKEAGEAQLETGDSVDRIVILQHPPVYTLGTGSTLGNLRFPEDNPPYPLHRTERGGEVTYHGPGQLVVYPILNLRHHQQDLHWYLRSLEEAVILALDAVHGLRGERVGGLTGVWCSGAKVCAMGVRAAKWVTYHGLALNVVNDLAPFRDIVPCGIDDRPVTSVRELLGLGPSQAATAALHAPPGGILWPREDEQLLREYAVALVDSLAQVFGLEVEEVERGGEKDDGLRLDAGGRLRPETQHAHVVSPTAPFS